MFTTVEEILDHYNSNLDSLIDASNASDKLKRKIKRKLKISMYSPLEKYNEACDYWINFCKISWFTKIGLAIAELSFKEWNNRHAGFHNETNTIKINKDLIQPCLPCDHLNDVIIKHEIGHALDMGSRNFLLSWIYLLKDIPLRRKIIRTGLTERNYHEIPIEKRANDFYGLTYEDFLIK